MNLNVIVNPYGQIKNPSEFSLISFLANKYPTLGAKKEFYALFDEPSVPNDACPPGESLSKKVGYSRQTLKEAIEKYGVYYKSGTTYRKQKDPHKGKLFAVYNDRANHRLHFIFNPEAFEKFCETLEIQLKSASEALRPTEFRSNKYINNINNKLNTTATELQWDTEKAEEDKIKAGKMMEFWEKIIGPFGPIWVGVSWLCSILKKFFQDSLEKWEAYCRKIASNKYLMGEGRVKFQAWLGWGLKKENIEDVEAGERYKADREIPETQEEKAQRLQQEALDIEAQIEQKDNPEVMKKLRPYFEPATFMSWVLRLNIGMVGNLITVYAPNPFMRDWAKDNLEKLIKTIWGIEVKFVLSTSPL